MSINFISILKIRL